MRLVKGTVVIEHAMGVGLVQVIITKEVSMQSMKKNVEVVREVLSAFFKK